MNLCSPLPKPNFSASTMSCSRDSREFPALQTDAVESCCFPSVPPVLPSESHSYWTETQTGILNLAPAMKSALWRQVVSEQEAGMGPPSMPLWNEWNKSEREGNSSNISSWTSKSPWEDILKMSYSTLVCALCGLPWCQSAQGCS